MDTGDDDLDHQIEQLSSETEAEETKAEETDAYETNAEESEVQKREAEESEAEEREAEESEAEESEAEESEAEETGTSESAKPELKAITCANAITDERNQLLIISNRKDRTIERLRSELKMLEVQLTFAVSAKSDALARLDSIEGKEQSLEYKEKRMEIEKNLLNSQISYLTDSLNRTKSELLAVRNESTTAAIQMKDELKRKTEQLRNTNASIWQLTEANQLLKTQGKENVDNLNEQVDKSADLLNKYQNQIDAKTQLVELFKMDSDADKAHIDTLMAASKEMRGMLYETVDQCVALATKLSGIEEKHRIELNTKTEVIEKLRQELKIANELLKTKEGKNTETDLGPSDVEENCRLNSCLTLTEICSRFYSVQEELLSKEREYDQLKLELEAIIAELQSKAPEFENLRVKYREIVAVNKELSQNINNYNVEKVLIREELQNARSKIEYLEQENAKLKCGQKDLAKQVCNLLNKINAPTPRIAKTSDRNRPISLDMPADQVISETLVTFNNIEELQENNQKLLLLVRDLSTKLEEMETSFKSFNVESYEAKITGYERELHNLQCQLSKRTIETMRFQRLYLEIMEDFCMEPSATNSLMSEHMERKNRVENSDQIASNGAKYENLLAMEKAEELRDVEKNKMLNEEINTLRNEVSELTETNLDMCRQVNNSNELIKTLRNDNAINKRKIRDLEDLNQMHEKTIDKHNISSKYLTAKVSNTMYKLSAVENRNEHLHCECRRLMHIIKCLEVERQQNLEQNREKLSGSYQQHNLEMIKESIERLDNEGCLRMSQRLDDISRENSALRLRLQLEQDHFRKEINDIKQEKENAEKKMSDEQAIAKTLRAKLIKAEEQIKAKNQEIIECVTLASVFDNASDDNNKLNELKKQLKDNIVEIESLKKQISVNAGKEIDFIQMPSALEGEAKHNFELPADLNTSQLNEIELKAQVQEMRSQITENERELEDWRSKFNTLTMNLKTIQHNYSNEMQVHSSDLLTLAICKDELNKCQVQMGQLRVTKDVADRSLEMSRLEWERFKEVATTDQLELEQKLECVGQQNIALDDQLRAQHNKVLTTNNDSINDSGNFSILDPTITEDEVNGTSSDKPLTIIKFLGKEKDVVKAEIYKSENTRLSDESEFQEKHLNELNLQLIEAQDIRHIASAADYDDLLRKIETVNAMTVSNVHLREERDVLLSKARDLTDKITTLEDELFEIQEINRELSVENEEQSHKLVTLRISLEYWMKRASDLVAENKVNIDDLKRLRNEPKKESLCQSDLNNLKQTSVRLTQELTERTSTIEKEEDDGAAIERPRSKIMVDNSRQLSLCQDESEKLRKENETLNEQDEKKLLANKIAPVKGLPSGGHKRPPDTDIDILAGLKESSSSEQATQNKRIRLSEQSCQIQATESDCVKRTYSQCEVIAGITDSENECSTFDDSASQINEDINVGINVDADDYINIESGDEIKVEEGHDVELRNRRSERIRCASMTVGKQRSIQIDFDAGVRNLESSSRVIRSVESRRQD